MIPILAQIITDAETPAEAELTRLSLGEVSSPYVWVFMVAFIVTFALTPLMRFIARRTGVVDLPDSHRKAHPEPVAYLGGVAVLLGWLAGAAMCLVVQNHFGELSTSLKTLAMIALGAGVITIVGVIDDIYGTSPRVKLAGQLFAAAALAGAEVGTKLATGVLVAMGGTLGFDPSIIPGFGHEIIYLDPSYWLGAILVTVLLVGGCNAMNLLDGLDGLAAGVTAITAAGLTFIALALAMGLYIGVPYSEQYDPLRLVVCMALFGAVLGFLPYNFNPANIFLGDAGSMLLGYLCISTILLFAELGNADAMTLVLAGLIVFALPGIDTSLAIIRRLAQRRPLFSPDSHHLHHQLIRAGLSVKQAVLVMYALSLCFAALGCTMIFTRLRFVAVVFMVMFGFVIVTAFKAGHRQRMRQLERPDASTTSARTAPLAPRPMQQTHASDGPPDAT